MLIVRAERPHAVHAHAGADPVVEEIPRPTAGLTGARNWYDEPAAPGRAPPAAAAFTADRLVVAQVELALEPGSST